MLGVEKPAYFDLKTVSLMRETLEDAWACLRPQEREISITYAGFATLVIIFRQTIGGKLSGLDTFFIRNVLARSVMIAGFAMLPPLLAMFALSPSTIWRASSLVARCDKFGRLCGLYCA